MNPRAFDPDYLEFHGRKFWLDPIGDGERNCQLSTTGLRGGGWYQAQAGVGLEAVRTMLAGGEFATVGEAEMFGRALASIAAMEDRHNPAPVIEPEEGFNPSLASVGSEFFVGLLPAVSAYVRVSREPDTDLIVVELETGSKGWLKRVTSAHWSGLAMTSWPNHPGVRAAVDEMLLERGRK